MTWADISFHLFLFWKISNKYRSRDHEPGIPFSVSFQNYHYMDNFFICTPIQPPNNSDYFEVNFKLHIISYNHFKRITHTALCRIVFRGFEWKQEEEEEAIAMSGQGKMSCNIVVGMKWWGVVKFGYILDAELTKLADRLHRGGEGKMRYTRFLALTTGPFSKTGKAREMFSGRLNLWVWRPGEEPGLGT